MNTYKNKPAHSALMPILYIPHGGGPMPLLGDQSHKALIEFLKNIHNDIPAPKAILMVSAHWESSIVSVSSASQPQMIYDYGGFPQQAYQYQYPAPGDPDLASRVAQLLSANSIACKLDPQRGYDHGTFVPLMLMYPNANIPIVQVSLVRSLDPVEHIKIGQAIASLREQGVLIVGSGMSFHNRNGSIQESLEFDHWLTASVTSSKPAQTKQDLIDWEKAPSARQCHAREEHLLPVHVCFGASYTENTEKHTPATKVFHDFLFGKKISAFMWQ